MKFYREKKQNKIYTFKEQSNFLQKLIGTFSEPILFFFSSFLKFDFKKIHIVIVYSPLNNKMLYDKNDN